MKHTAINLRNRWYFFCMLSLLYSCGFVHFSDAQLPEAVQTFSIQVYSEISDGPSDMAQNMMDALEGNVIRFAPYLTKVEREGDIHYSCVIKNFSWRTVFTRDEASIDGKEIEELTIAVQLSYESSVEEVAHTFTNKIFSKSKISDSSSAKENELANEIIKELAADICERSINYWE
ncbi:MAG: hypothetical protein NQ127_02305 [Candidatus Cardinium sp.]|nr:hypothetical protein [Candidatus Cardinium sp.]